ncbi:hypothetical protein DFJ73DRAFT_812630, partial [Zopfochytrium polystomum]
MKQLRRRPAYDLVAAAALHLISISLSIAATASLGWIKFRTTSQTTWEGLFSAIGCEDDSSSCITGDTFCAIQAPSTVDVAGPCGQLKAMAGLMVTADIIGLAGMFAYPLVFVLGDRVNSSYFVISGFGTLFITSIFNLAAMSLCAAIKSSSLFGYISGFSTISYGPAFVMSIFSWLFGFGACGWLGFTYMSFKDEF